MRLSVNKYLVILLILFSVSSCGGGGGGASPPGANIAPTAKAGLDRSVLTNLPASLDGSNSSDPDGDSITYEWVVIDTPDTSNISTDSLSNSAIVNPSFTPDVDGDYIFELVVNDGTLNSSADSVKITAITGNLLSDQNALISTGSTLFDGSELTDVYSVDVNTFTVNVTVLGGVFCLPANLNASPVASSIPPATLYGCDNSILGTVNSLAVDNSSITFTVTVPDVYLDYSVSGISSSGYATATDVTYEFTVMLSPLPDGSGNYEYGSISTFTVNIPAANFVISGSLASFLTASLVEEFRIAAEGSLAVDLKSIMETYIPSLAPFAIP